MGDYRPERVQRKRKKRTFVSMNERHIDINEFDYDLPDGRIAKFPLAERSASKLLVYRGGEIGEAHFADIGDVLPEGDSRTDHHAQAFGCPHRGVLSRTARSGRLRTGVRRRRAVRMVVHRGQPQEMERGVCGDQLRARRPPGASAGVARREPRPRAYRALRVVGGDDVRAAARIPRTDSDSALPEPRKRGDRLYALPDRLFQIRRIGGRADGGAALHARTDRGDEGARLRVRGGDAACRGRDLSARQGRRCTPSISRCGVRR